MSDPFENLDHVSCHSSDFSAEKGAISNKIINSRSMGIAKRKNTFSFMPVTKKQTISANEQGNDLYKNPAQCVVEPLNFKKDICSLPGCNKRFLEQKAYEIHIKHFHGVFNFKKSEPIITASFYNSRRMVIGENSDNVPCQPNRSCNIFKLPSKFSVSEILLPESLVKAIDVVSAGKSVAEVIYENYYEKKKPIVIPDKSLYVCKFVSVDKKSFEFEKCNKNISISCKKTDPFLQKQFSTEKSEGSKLLNDNIPKKSSNAEHKLQHFLSNTSDDLITAIIQVNKEDLISDINNSAQEKHLFASNIFENSHDGSVDHDKLNTGSDIDCKNAIISGSKVYKSKDVCSYEEFVKKKEKEYLDSDSSIRNKCSMLEEISQKKNCKNQDMISTAVSLVLRNLIHNPLNSNISQNTTQKEINEKVDFIRRSFKLCNCARNLREILFKCKQILDRLGDYTVPKDGNIDTIHLPIPDVTKKPNKLLHHVFFLDILRDPSFSSIYIQHILTETEKAVLKKLTNPVSLYLTNTETELPNVKLRRDREFLQRNSDFFHILLRIHKSCHILPYAQSSVSAEELCQPSTRLRLEKSDYFAQVFFDIKTEKSHISMQSYGVDKDLYVSPFVECDCDNYNMHKLSGFILLPRPDNNSTEDMCVGLCFESTSLSIGDCIFELSLITEEIKKIISKISVELCKKSTEYHSAEITNNLLVIFDLLGTETNSVFSSLNAISHFVNEMTEIDKKSYFDKNKIELTINSLKEIGKIMDDLKDLKECDTI